MPSCHGVCGSPAVARLLRPWQPRHAAPCRGLLIYGNAAPRIQPARRGPWWDSLSPRVASSERRMGTGWQASFNKCADTLRSGSTHKIDLWAPLPGLERGTCRRNLNSILALLAARNSVDVRPLPDPRRSCWSLKNLIFSLDILYSGSRGLLRGLHAYSFIMSKWKIFSAKICITVDLWNSARLEVHTLSATIRLRFVPHINH